MLFILLGDVHANLPALDAVLEHAAEHGAATIWNVGDFVGYNAFPDEVVKRLRQHGALSIRGNYDRKTLKVKKKEDKWKATKTPEKWLAFRWAYDHLSKSSRKYLKSLPEEVRFDVLGWKVLMVHGSPADPDEYLTPETPIERLQELAEMARADLVICGHSHTPFKREVGNTWFINPGTIGRPDDGDPRASYAMLRLEPGVREVQHFRVEYDVQRAQDAIREQGLPEEFEEMIGQGKDLNAVKGEKE
jgi:putative phosphoesterase